MKIFLNGAKGRMGVAIAAAATDMGHEIAASCDEGDDAQATIGPCEVAIDFSFHAATPVLATLCAEKGLPLVIGTTGHTEEERAAILAHKGTIPIVWAGNYSVGVNVLNHLVARAAQLLDESYQIEITEMHHRHKVDAPSGTAAKLIEIVRQARKLPESAVVHGRSGETGARPKEQIGVHALRGGSVVGDHTVIFAGEGERVELTHKAEDRQIFARGAVRAALWALSAKPGLYGMEDVLGIGS